MRFLRLLVRENKYMLIMWKGDETMKTLRDISVGESAEVLKIHGEGALKKRIMDMGITKGTKVYVRKVAPLGDPVEVTVRGYELSLRKEDADILEMR
uniref:Fe2+ transport system protein A n=2 Tax=Eubacterium cellulosolvens TaxID=29322 RepID=I5AT97_EUBC6